MNCKNTAPSHQPSSQKKYSIIIPAAGLGKRMKIYGPKSLIHINGVHTILSKQLMNIRKLFKQYEIILVGGYQIHKLKKHCSGDIKLIENPDYENTNVIESIRIGLDNISTDNAVIIYGDLVFNSHCLSVPFYNESALVLCDSMKTEEVGCVVSEKKIQYVFYEIEKKWAQIAYFTGQELSLLKEFFLNNSDRNLYGFEVINRIIDMGGMFKPYEPQKAFAYDIDTSYDLRKLCNGKL